MSPGEFQKAYPFIIESRVEWGDMDAYQHVNNTVFFRYFERVRIAYMEHIGLAASVRDTGIGAILASTQCRFRAPLTYPDLLLIGTSICEVGSDRFRMNYGVFSREQELVAAEGDGVIVCYDYNRIEKAPIPEAMRARLEQEAVEPPP